MDLHESSLPLECAEPVYVYVCKFCLLVVQCMFSLYTRFRKLNCNNTLELRTYVEVNNGNVKKKLLDYTKG